MWYYGNLQDLETTQIRRQAVASEFVRAFSLYFFVVVVVVVVVAAAAASVFISHFGFCYVKFPLGPLIKLK